MTDYALAGADVYLVSRCRHQTVDLVARELSVLEVVVDEFVFSPAVTVEAVALCGEPEVAVDILAYVYHQGGFPKPLPEDVGTPVI